MARIVILLSVVLIGVYQTEQAYFLEKSYIDRINEVAKTWTAGVNFNPNTPEEHFVKMLGSIGVESAKKASIDMFKTNDDAYDNDSGNIPRSFDARKKWRHCTTIGEVRDQGNCGSCWAFGTSSAFADRLCVATNGDFNELLSAEELTFCCHSCGFGCHGGDPIKAWKYFRKHGLVTGGNYESNEGCEPYRVPPCLVDDDGNNTCAGKPMEKNHRCTRMCYGEQNIDYDQDHRYTRDYYYLTYNTIQNDVMTYGPIEATFDVYDDFPNYKSGVYVKTDNASYLGGHAVKLIGWGEERGTPYWLMVNSWNDQWGDQGLFKIRRGTNECGIDNSTTGGVPMTN
ncbi:PREDICTED: cathepsin B-like cysteine proteinase 4 isoform X2 [Diuraphis noxia]|uniref:cathepsin B-like cysteine proteinase 4 isoform X2 n=1 Tax=Diuraphis noxia TaxID=143948 RepID=UPI0007638D9D|nr:PREDICTED: cathepsin B-like cysteine proteinase 4 isoform X2 [Diuraphis noxia]